MRIPESNFAAPEGTPMDVTVCCSASRSFQIMVLFTPTTTTTLDGWKFSDSLSATPNGIVITTVELKVRLVVVRVSLLVVELVELVVAVLVWLVVLLEDEELADVVLLVLLVVLSKMLTVEKVSVVELEVLEVVP